MDNKKLYEDFDWTKLDKKTLLPKIKEILSWIPDDCNSILDVGCGNGAITNVLNEHYVVTGVDRSESALKTVVSKKIAASSDKIPLEDESYDMVFSSELLEHLPDEILQGTVKEMKRLTKKYIFITVPNDENPDKLSIKCPECGYIYNRPNHLRSFNTQKIASLFPEFKIIKEKEFGPKTRYYNNRILKLKLKYTPPTSWVPYYWIDKNKRDTFCPRCEHKFYFKYKFHPLATSLDVLNVLISPKKPYWLFVLLEKK